MHCVFQTLFFTKHGFFVKVFSDKIEFHPALIFTNIKDNIPFILDMVKDYYVMWIELFETNTPLLKFFIISSLNPGGMFDSNRC